MEKLFQDYTISTVNVSTFLVWDVFFIQAAGHFGGMRKVTVRRNERDIEYQNIKHYQ
jgi:hypothetical protein